MTQPAFHHGPLGSVEPFRDQRPFLVGVLILSSYDQARRLAQIPGVVVPDEILQRLAKYESVADQAKAGQEIAIEQIRWVKRTGWRGLYLMSPGTHHGILEVLRAGLA